MDAKPIRSILFVCLGNICRSPLAEGVFRDVLIERGLAHRFLVDSAGTGGWHTGSAPDPRSVAIAASHGVDISDRQARKVVPDDFARFDLILGMDRSNVEALRAAAPEDTRGRIRLFTDFAGAEETVRLPANDVPDPYYGGADGFAVVYRMIREASERLVEKLAARASFPESGQASSTM